MRKNTAAAVLAAAMAFSAGTGCLSFAAENIAETAATETADMAETETETETELVYEEEKIMYLTDTVNVRVLPDSDSEIVGYADRGEAIAVIGEVGDWYHVRLGEVELPAGEETEAEAVETELGTDSQDAEASQEEKTGYVRAKFLSENKSDADDAVAANDAEAARQAEAAAEAARQQAAAAAAGAAPSSGASSGRTMVSQEKVDDCDGSGHGVLIITYSDGTTETEEY